MVEMDLHQPSKLKLILWMVGLWQIEPGDIGNHHAIINKYRSIGGDPDLGFGNDGDCPDYRGDRGWWKRFLKDHGV